MAKTARLKNSNKAPSPHSRLSRRASSPTLNLDKSLTRLRPPRSSAGSILAPSHGAGVGKAYKSEGVGEGKGSGNGKGMGKGKGRVLKRKQKMRVERGRDRAEVVGDRVERKRGRGRRGVGRNADWDELNEKIGVKREKRGKGKAEGEGGEEGWEDEGMDVDIHVDGDVDGDGGAGNELAGKEGVENLDTVKDDGVDGVVHTTAAEEEVLL